MIKRLKKVKFSIILGTKMYHLCHSIQQEAIFL